MSFYENGEVYEGEINNDLPNGFGILYRICKEKIYEGFFEDGKKNGKGSYRISDNHFYEGEFKKNELHGKGLFINDREVYNGEWLNNQKNGLGKITYYTGERYEGEFKNNIRNGKGILFKANGEIYDGSWMNDMRKGNGVLTYPTGCKLIGMWDDELNNFDGKFYGNPKDANEYNTCKIVNEKLIEKSDKYYDIDSNQNFNKEFVIKIEFNGNKYDLLLTKFA